MNVALTKDQLIAEQRRLLAEQERLSALQDELIAKLKAEIASHQLYKSTADKLLEFYKGRCEALKATIDENTVQVKHARSMAEDAYDRLTYHDFYAAARTGNLPRYFKTRSS